MGLDLSILYRGPLESCNYGCGYCPFAKTHDDRAALARDAAALERFTRWALGRAGDRLRILFTPWGEALIRAPYREAMIALSHAPMIERIAIQTNLSCSVAWMDALAPGKALFWCSYHPGETPRAAFLEKCEAMRAMGVAFTIGAVGLKAHIAEIEALRRDAPPDIYLWVNAYKDRGPRYYAREDVERLHAVDPFFRVNLADHPSLGRACAAGETAIAVDGEGVIRRCHFTPEIIGDLYAPGGVEAALQPRRCPRALCRCHIGYAHLRHLGLDALFGAWALGRAPSQEALARRVQDAAPPARPRTVRAIAHAGRPADETR